MLPMNLHGPTVSLVPLALEHVADFCRYSAEPTLWDWWLRKPPVDEPTMRAEVEIALDAQAKGQRQPFAIFHRERGEHIGSTSLWFHDARHRSIEIGSTWLALPFHRSGINRECKELLLRHAFGELGVNRVVLQTDALNLRSRRAIEKLGAKLDGVLREDKVTWNGRIRSSALYSLLRAEWAESFAQAVRGRASPPDEPVRCAGYSGPERG